MLKRQGIVDTDPVYVDAKVLTKILSEMLWTYAQQKSLIFLFLLNSLIYMSNLEKKIPYLTIHISQK
jgi:hypothetical protein